MSSEAWVGASLSAQAGPRRQTDGRLRLLAAAEQLLATRGLEVPNREIIIAADLRNRSAVTYHFGSRAGLIEAIRERHETPINQHRRLLVSRLPGPEGRTTRQLVGAYIQPLAVEMLRCAPSYWARLSELLLLADPWPRYAGSTRLSPDAGLRRPVDVALSSLLELTVAHLSHLPEPEAVSRVMLTSRFLNASLARWEHDRQAGLDSIAPLPSFTLILTDLAVAMLNSPSSGLPQIDAELRHPQPAGG